jgi:DNA-binding transcriptional ArsR family regulator
MSFEKREPTNPRALRALAHPTRLALLELLAYYGPLTATEAAEHLGESPASCSFHFRQLARHGFIDEAGGGSGRQRPWRIVKGADFAASDPDADTAVAGAALTQVVEARRQQLVDTWRTTAHTYPAEWQQATFATYRPTFLTAKELASLGEAIEELFAPYRDRVVGAGERPPDGLPVAFIAQGFPVTPPRADREPPDDGAALEAALTG